MNRHERRAAMAMLRGKGDAFQAGMLKADIQAEQQRQADEIETEQDMLLRAEDAARIVAEPWWKRLFRRFTSTINW